MKKNKHPKKQQELMQREKNRMKRKGKGNRKTLRFWTIWNSPKNCRRPNTQKKLAEMVEF